jgi:hypothetical protein
MDKKFTINYDDQPNDVVDTISGALSAFNLTIEEISDGDGWIEFVIISKKEKQCTAENS